MADGEGYETPSPGNPAGFIAYGLSVGKSGNEILREWRDLGGSSGNESWRRMVGSIADTINRTDDMAALDPGALPTAADYGEWQMGRGGQYATQVAVTARDDETGLLTTSQYTYVSNEPHTPDEAVEAAMDEYGISDNAAAYGQDVLGAFVTHVWQTVPFAL